MYAGGTHSVETHAEHPTCELIQLGSAAAHAGMVQDDLVRAIETCPFQDSRDPSHIGWRLSSEPPFYRQTQQPL